MSFGLDFDNSSESTTDARTTGAQSQQGGAATVSIGPTNKSNQNTTVNILDGGVVKDAFDFAKSVAGSLFSTIEDVAAGSENVVTSALDSNEFVTTYAIDKVVQGYQGAGDLVNSALNDYVYLNEKSLQTVNESISANRAVTQDALYQSSRVVDLTEKINKDNLFFLSDVNDKNADLFGAVAQTFSNTTENVINSISDLEESRQIESGSVIDTIKELAETVQTGGESITTNANKYIAFAVVAGAVVLGWRSLK